MKIGLAGISLEVADAGFKRYFEQLVRGIASQDSCNKYVLFLNSTIYDKLRVKQANFENVRVHVPFQNIIKPRISLIWEQIYFPCISALNKLDVLHSCVSAVPIFARMKTVLTVYDLMYLILPETQTRLYRFYWTIFLPLSLKIARKVIAISESTKMDIIKRYHIPEEKVHVVYPYVSPFFIPTNQCRKVLTKYQIPDKYILYVGTIERRKNLLTLIKAFALAKKQGSIKHKLVLVGRKEVRYSSFLEKFITDLKLGKDVIWCGYVPDEDLPALYSSADLFVYISLYEGFGLPVLEAMACGTPVLTSNVSSLPEIVGDMGIMVAPNDVEMIAYEMTRILKDRFLHEKLAKRGIEQATKFSAEKSIRQIINLYYEVAQQ